MTSEKIISDVSAFYNVKAEDVLSNARTRRLVDARAVICYLAHNVLGFTLCEIGNDMHRAHSSVHYLVGKADDWVKQPFFNPFAVYVIKEIQKQYLSSL